MFHNTVSRNTGMGAREMINAHPIIVGSIVGGFVLILLIILLNAKPSSGGNLNIGEAAFSIDDGKTYFTASADNIPPFSRRGSQAVGAKLFMGDDGKPFVGYLFRYTPDGRVRREQEIASGDPQALMMPSTAAFEVKKPGEKNWCPAPPFTGKSATVVEKQSKAFAEVIDVRGPDGKPAHLARVR